MLESLSLFFHPDECGGSYAGRDDKKGEAASRSHHDLERASRNVITVSQCALVFQYAVVLPLCNCSTLRSVALGTWQHPGARRASDSNATLGT